MKTSVCTTVVALAKEHLAMAERNSKFRDVSSELDVVEAILRGAPLKPEDIGTTLIGIKTLRLEGVLASGLTVMQLAIASEARDDGLRMAFNDLMNVFAHADALRRSIPPKLPRTSDEDVVQQLLDFSPFLRAADNEPRLVCIADDGAFVFEGVDGEFTDVTESDCLMEGSDDAITAAVEMADVDETPITPRSFRDERRIMSFFANREEAYLFGVFPADLAEIHNLDEDDRNREKLAI